MVAGFILSILGDIAPYVVSIMGLAHGYVNNKPDWLRFKDNIQGVFSGRRIYRGLYKAADGTTINADVNGAANILRKVSGYSFELPSSGCLAHPLRISFS